MRSTHWQGGAAVFCEGLVLQDRMLLVTLSETTTCCIFIASDDLCRFACVELGGQEEECNGRGCARAGQ